MMFRFQKIWANDVDNIREKVIELWQEKNVPNVRDEEEEREQEIIGEDVEEEEEEEEKEKEEEKGARGEEETELILVRAGEKLGKEKERIHRNAVSDCQKKNGDEIKIFRIPAFDGEFVCSTFEEENLSEKTSTVMEGHEELQEKNSTEVVPNTLDGDIRHISNDFGQNHHSETIFTEDKELRRLEENIPELLVRNDTRVLNADDSLDFPLDDDRKEKNYQDSGDDKQLTDDENSVADDNTRDETDSSANYSDDGAEIVRPEMHHSLGADFCVTRGKFCVPLEEGLMNRDSFTVNAEKARVFLKNVLPLKLSIKCCLNFYGERQNKNSFVQYGKCRYKECAQRFRFEISHNAFMPLTVFVYSTNTSDEVHPNNYKLYYQQRGQERKDAQKELEYMKPRQMELAELSTIDVELANAGNMQALRSLSVYQKARSEDKAKYDLTLQSKDLQDLMQLQVEEKLLSNPYLQHASNLNATMFCEETIRAVGPGKILRGDATGNICRAPAGGDYKRILYYAFVVTVSRVVLPVLEFITSEHNVMEISIGLMRFRYFVEAMENVFWPYFQIVIVDWSWALIHAFMKEWNDTDIYIYLRRTCNYALHGESYPARWTIVHNCSVHFLKRVSDKLDDLHKEFAGKNFVMDCMASMVESTNIDELDAIFDRMMTVLVTPFEHETTIVRQELFDMKKKGVHEKEDNSENEPRTSEKRRIHEDAIHKDSPFYCRYLHRLNSIKTQFLPSQDHNSTNKLQSLTIAQYIVDHYMPFATMWTEILIYKVDPKIKHLHNQHIESYFHNVKDQVLDKNENLSIGRVVRRLKSYAKSLTKSTRFGVIRQKGSKPKPEFPERENVDIPRAADPNVQEEWRKGSKKLKGKRRTHFEGRFLKKAEESDDSCQMTTKEKRLKRKQQTKKTGIVIKHVSSRRRRCSETSPEPSSSKFTIPQQISKRILKRKRCDEPAEKNKRQCIRNEAKTTCPEEEQDLSKEEKFPQRTWSNAQSSVLNQSDTSFHQEAMHNGFFNDPEYYMQSIRQSHMTVGRFRPEQEMIEHNEIQLEQYSFKTLNYSVATQSTAKWLDEKVLDAFAYAHIDTWDNVSYIPTTSTSYIIGDYLPKHREIFDKQDNDIFFFDSPFNNTVFLPYLRQSHWRLLVLQNEKTLVKVVLLDPFEDKHGNTDKTELKRAMGKLKEFALQCPKESSMYKLLKEKKWIPSSYKKVRSYQTDTYNCGVYILYFMHCLGNNIPMTESFNSNMYRETVARTLLEKSLNMKETCLYCFHEKNTQLVMCKYCRRYAHSSCIPGKRRKAAEWAEPSTEFKCSLCAFTVREWMIRH